MLKLPKSTTCFGEWPGLPWDVIAKLRARGIVSVGGAVRAIPLASGRRSRIARAILRMRLDTVLDREAVHLFLMLRLAADLPAMATPRRTRRRLPER